MGDTPQDEIAALLDERVEACRAKDVDRLMALQTGADDFLVHLSARSPDELRDVVLDNISSRPGVSHVQTSLVFRAHGGHVAV